MGQKTDVTRHLNNKVRPRVPREFICLIGGTSISVNGWFTWIHQKSKPNDSVDVGGPAPTTYEEIKYYVNFKMATFGEWGMRDRLDETTADAHERRYYGWSDDAIEKVKAQGWDQTEVVADKSEVHDLYWGNFVDSAIHLYGKTGRIVAPMQGVMPEAGDVVTFLVYDPPYVAREKVDWDASPFNFNHRTKLEAQKYWSDSVTSNTGGPKPTPAPAPVPRTDREIKEAKEEQERKDQIKKQAEEELRTQVLSEADLNFYIIMRTTGENDKGIIRRPTQPDSYHSYLGEKLGLAGWKDGILQKVLLCKSDDEVLDYISTGKMGDDMMAMLVPSQRPPATDVHNRPLKVNYTWNDAWDKGYDIDRSKIRIQRFDYIGHSGPSDLLLDYGATNPKGKPPVATVTVDADTLAGAFAGKVLTPDALACLWGCYLGMPADDGTIFAARLAKLFGSGVVAADTATSFEQIVTSPANLPVPIQSRPWKLFPHPQAGH